METLNIILLVITILGFIVLIIDLFVDDAKQENSPFFHTWLITQIVIGTFLLSSTPSSDKQYKPKTKVTLTSDSTYYIDTLYYIKIK